MDYSSLLKTKEPIWVKIQNTSTGGLNIQGIIITYLDTTNGITTVERPVNNNQDFYDLSGRRIVEPKRGQLYIQNGRKFIYR